MYSTVEARGTLRTHVHVQRAAVAARVRSFSARRGGAAGAAAQRLN